MTKSISAFFDNAKEFLDDLSIKKYSFNIVREHYNKKGIWCNPQVFVILDDNSSLVQQDKNTKEGIKSIKNVKIDSMPYLDGLMRYFSNEITKADDLKTELEKEKSVKEVSILWHLILI